MSKLKRSLSIFLIFVFVTVLFVPISVSAAEEISIDKSSVIDDLKTYYADPELAFPKKSADNKIYLVHFIEAGYNEIEGIDSSDYGLYLYLYNPSGKTLSGEQNKVQFAIRWSTDGNGNYNPTDYLKYDLSVVNANSDNTLIKYRVKYPDSSLVCERYGSRRYDISGFELANTDYDIEDYTVGYTYTFTGYAKGLSFDSVDKSTLSCVRKSLTTISVKAHQVSYLTGNSGLGAGYSNQINSVYFSIPKDIVENYGDLYEIKYEYNHFYTSPIIVTNNETSFNTLLADVGKKVDKDKWNYNLYNRNATGVAPVISYDYNFHFGYRNNSDTLVKHWYEDSEEPNIFPEYLATLFHCYDSWETGDLLYTADELETYFKNYQISYHTGNKLGYSADLFDLKKSNGYQVMIKNINDAFDLEGSNDNLNRVDRFKDWIHGITDDDYDMTGVKYIEKINSSSVFDKAGFSAEYLVGDRYKDDFKKFYTTATANGENVYLLRYAHANDYYSLDLRSDELEGDFIMNQGNVYLNFDFIHFGFGDSENLTIIPVVSDPTNGFFDGMDTTPDNVTASDIWEEILNGLKKLGRIVGIVLIVLIVIAAVVLLFIFIKPLNDWLIAIFSNDKKKNTPKAPKAAKTRKKAFSSAKSKSKKSYSSGPRKKKYKRRN